MPFSPDPTTFPYFLDGLPLLSPAQHEGLKVPFSFPELDNTVQKAAANKFPGLDGLSYEFNRTALLLVGPPRRSALNAMRGSYDLTASHRPRVVQINPTGSSTPKSTTDFFFSNSL